MARPSTIDTHPQKKKILQALLDGETVRSIAEWAKPAVSVTAIQRYKSSVIKPAIERSGTRVRNLNRVTFQKVSPNEPETVQAAMIAVQDAPVLELRDARIQLLQTLIEKLKVVMEERAEAYADAPGGRSGLIVQDFKGAGENMVPVYKVDGVVLSEARDLVKQIDQHLGQWVEKQDVSVKAEVSAKVVALAEIMTPAQLRQAERILLAEGAQAQLAAPVTLAAPAEAVNSTERENASER
jgi:hypothetical protein